MTLDYSRPSHPVSFPASPVRCLSCGIKFQSGHVPAGDPVCLECLEDQAATDQATPDPVLW